MRLFKRNAVKAFAILLAAVCLIGSFGGVSAKAANYPTVYISKETTNVAWYVGDVVPLIFYYLPSYKNEDLLVEVYDENDALVASADKLFSNTEGGSIIEYTVTWKTEGYDPGKYKIVVHKYFYTFYEWHEAPTVTTEWVTLIDASSRYENADAALSLTKLVYNGKAQKPEVNVFDGAGKTIDSKYYNVKWSNAKSKSVGKYTVTVTFKSPYSGTKTLSYSIAPKKVTGLKNAASATKSVKLSWKEVTGAIYYQVYAKNDSGAWEKVKTVSENSAVISEIGGKALKAGKTYAFKVRALDDTKKITGKFSDALKTGTKTAAPVISKLTSEKSKNVKAVWGKVTGAKKYVVYTSLDNETWKKAKTTTDTSITLTGLTGGKQIYVKVAAVNEYGIKSAYSEVMKIKVKK